MIAHRTILVLAPLIAALLGGPCLADDEDVADIKSQDLRAEKDPKKRFFLVGPHKGVREPKKGYGLIVALPGGDGGAATHSFIKRIFKHSVPEGYLLAQPVSVKWNDKQEIVWPVEKNRVEGMKFSTEELVDTVIRDVSGRHKVDPARIFTLTWSSSGPAAYAVSLTNKKVRGSFIAMSVFKPDLLPPLEKAKGHAYYLYHSPDDRICPYRMAEQAVKDLKKNGAEVTLSTYKGGHGWRAGLYDHIRDGVRWLEKNSHPPEKP
jgi:predicted esterase